jgi:DNA-binding GntR family transcriptional regulator
VSDTNEKKVPRYREIADELIAAIVARRFPVGSTLPAETELCAQWAASRHTIREALRILEEGGLISRRQGSGSEVVADTPPVRFRQTVDTIEDLLQYGAESRLALLGAGEVAATAEIAASLQVAEGTQVIEIVGLRSERGEARPDGTRKPGRPFALTTIWLPPQPPRRREKFLNPETALPLLLAALDARALGRIDQVFTAVALDAATADRLHTRKGAPSLQADRTYHDKKGALVLFARSLHRADLFRYATVLRHEVV